MKRWLLSYLPDLPTGQTYQIVEEDVLEEEIISGRITIAGRNDKFDSVLKK